MAVLELHYLLVAEPMDAVLARFAVADRAFPWPELRRAIGIASSMIFRLPFLTSRPYFLRNLNQRFSKPATLGVNLVRL